jgi:hypothetical protein
MDPDQTARMRMMVWIHADRKPIMLVMSWRGSYYEKYIEIFNLLSSTDTDQPLPQL